MSEEAATQHRSIQQIPYTGSKLSRNPEQSKDSLSKEQPSSQKLKLGGREWKEAEASNESLECNRSLAG